MKGLWPVATYIADPTSAPWQPAYYNFSENDSVLRGIEYLSNDEQKAAIRAAMFHDMARDFHRGVSKNLIDLSPLLPRGRVAFADENKNMSDILSPDYYNSINDVGHSLFGPSNDKLEHPLKFGLSKRLNDYDKELARKLVLNALATNLPVDDSEIQEYATQLFRNGANLNEVSAKTRQWILDKSGTNSLEEYMHTRQNGPLRRLWAIANSTAPAKVMGDMYGITDINQGYYDAEGISNDYLKNVKTGMTYANLAGMLGAGKVVPWLVWRDANKVLSKVPAGAFSGAMNLAAIGSNGVAAYENLSNSDARTRFIMSELSNGRDPFKPGTQNMLYDAILNTYGLPYSTFVGPGSATRLYHSVKYKLDPEYRKEIDAIKKRLGADGFLEASGVYKKDKDGRLHKRSSSLSEHVGGSLGKSLAIAGLSGSMYPKVLLAGIAGGTADAAYDSIKNWDDVRKGVLDDDDYAMIDADKVDIKDSPRLSKALTHLKTTTRHLSSLPSDPWGFARRTYGAFADTLKYRAMYNRLYKELGARPGDKPGEIYVPAAPLTKREKHG